VHFGYSLSEKAVFSVPGYATDSVLVRMAEISPGLRCPVTCVSLST
jgi:hypothetical protein